MTAMRIPFAILVLGALTNGGVAQEIVSEYTDFVPDQHCSVFSSAADGEGDWANMVCAGYRGYPVVVYYSDAREAVFYGFPPDGDLAPAWESFGAFNSTSAKIEWRIERDNDRETPFATIHRWFVSDPADVEGTRPDIEVLAVEKVGQIHGREGCLVGYVMATGNQNANEKARRMADTKARDFACGDEPLIDAGTVAVPQFVRWEN